MLDSSPLADNGHAPSIRKGNSGLGSSSSSESWTPESCLMPKSMCSLLPDTAFLNIQHCLSGRDCFGVLDCEWCMVDSDGKTHLDKSYCAPQKECFGGIVGAKSPYVDDMGSIGNVLGPQDFSPTPQSEVSTWAVHTLSLQLMVVPRKKEPTLTEGKPRAGGPKGWSSLYGMCDTVLHQPYGRK